MDADFPADPYVTLGVARDATVAAIRTAYKKLALSTHPDKVQDESLRAQKQDEFQKIQSAYETLTDDDKRREYEEAVKKAKAKAKEAEFLASRAAGYRFEVRTATFEIRTAAPRPDYDRVYEQRKATRSFDDDLGYFEDRSSSRKHDQYGQSRKASRGYDERVKGRSEDDDRVRAKAETERQRATDRGYQSERRRQREKDRRRDTDDKYHRVAMHDEDDDEMESRSYRYKSEEPVSSSRRRRDADESAPRSKDDAYRRESARARRNNSSLDPDAYDGDSKLHSAREYIQRSSTRGDRDVEDAPGRPAGPQRSSTSTYYIRPSGVVPPEVDTVRRSHARRSSDRDHPRGSSERHRPSRKDSSREPVSIVDPPEVEPRSSRAGAPTLPHATSSPSALRASLSAAAHIRRAETFQDGARSPREPRLPRSSTMPVEVERSSRATRDPLTRGSSKLKGGHPADSGYSSPGTPDSPPLGSTYRKSSKDAEYIVVEEAFTPRPAASSRHYGAFVESDASDSDEEECRVRSVSPPPRRGQQHPSSSRPPLFGEVSYSSSKHTPVGRSSSYMYADDPSPSSRRGSSRKEAMRGASHATPGLLRTGSGFTTPGRGGGAPPFGRADSGFHRSKAIYDDVAFSPRYGKDDVMYSTGGGERRGSFGESGYGYRDHHFVHPGLMRAETSR